MTQSMDTQLQNFWVESINKEASLRFAWHLRYSKKFAKDAVHSEAAANRPRRKKEAINSNVSERIRQLEGGRPQRRRQSTTSSAKTGKDPRLVQSDGAVSMKDMRPASTNTRSLLYNGISAHGEGRYAYLKKRRSLVPERKYEFPILSSCQYGWKIMDFANPKPSAHARTCVIRDSFYRNSGIILG